MTKKTRNIIYLLVFVLVLLVYGLYNFTKTKDIDTLIAEPMLELTAEDLISYLELHKNTNDKQYLEKVIAIKGVVKEINNLNERHTILLKGGKDDATLIICDMNPSQSIEFKKLKPGDTVNVKGIYKGFLKDVVLLNCVIANKKTND